VIERGTTWLKAQLDGMDSRTAAYALFSLTMVGDPDLGSAQRLADQVLADELQLDAFARAALAVALPELGDEERAKSLVADLISEAKETDQEAF
jgi:uncharacterized protein YfaS (alpha-2-macroglobulin family)